MTIDRSTLVVGKELAPYEVQLSRRDLIRYAGASGDFNVIHWNERVAKDVGLPNVIAHGMLTMGQAINVVTRWLGSSIQIREYSVRFSNPVVVEDNDTGATLHFSGTITEISDSGEIKIDITAVCDSKKVLTRAYAIVQIPE
jgi:acyl dehydratase